eukprot:TRINITY_DN9464_c0_g1_i1.p1 TRINITY_DN9464_c0_g1~~TRINITY_DN9464_c0_g1_i1.p1  ORF type:complete len:348 (-),score=61.80 TRINITY_DN9464_c0_g1_i1:87-1130(-)
MLAYQGAGVLPYTIVNGGVLVLLGAEQTRKDGTGLGYWADFGGKREESDANELCTAAREFAEETKGVFNDGIDAATSASQSTVDSSRKAMLSTLTTASGVQRVCFKTYVLFIAPVPYVDERVFAVFPSTAGPTNALEFAVGEKRDIAWIPAEKLVYAALTYEPMHHRQRRHMVLAYRLCSLMQTLRDAQGPGCTDLFASFRNTVTLNEHSTWHMVNTTASFSATVVSSASSVLGTSATALAEAADDPLVYIPPYVDHHSTAEHSGTSPPQALRLTGQLEAECMSLYVSFAEWASARNQVGSVGGRRKRKRVRFPTEKNICKAQAANATQMWRDLIAEKMSERASEPH